MKKFCLLLSILIVAAVAMGCLNVSGGKFAYAENEWSYAFEADDVPLYINNIVDGNNDPIGVRFGGYYFGSSGISVSVDVYSSPQLDLSFWINGSALNSAQADARQKLVSLFTDVHRYINSIDALANTGYDGSKLANGKQLPISDVYRYNTAKQGDKLFVSRDTYNMLLLARQMYEQTQGAFNPAVYRLVDLWGFSSRIYSNGIFDQPYDRKVSSDTFWTDGYPLPDDKYVRAFSDPAFTDFSQQSVIIGEENGDCFIVKNVAPAVVDGVEFQQWIDLGGIAKGYVVDGIKAMLTDLGLTRFGVDAGSSSMAYGLDYDGGSVTLEISDPFDPYSFIYPTALVEMDVEQCSISTSGQNVRKYVTDGVEYSHIIDGVTGKPAQTGVRSVTVVVPDSAGAGWAAMGDCLTTALTVVGRDGIVEFANGVAKQLGIKILVVYQTLDGRKQLLSNYDRDEIKGVSDSYKQFDWALRENDEGDLVYGFDAGFRAKQDVYKTLTIVLGCALGVVVVALAVYHLAKGRKRTLSNVRNAKKDKAFKLCDILVYIGVVIVILVLFAVFVFDVDGNGMQTVSVVDDETGETLFVYNFTRNEYQVNDASSNGWIVEVSKEARQLIVTFTKIFDGEERFNQLTVTLGSSPSVKMTDAICGFHRDCVRNFPAIDRAGGAIVCSPNRLKVITA